jgi:hypothetical protein
MNFDLSILNAEQYSDKLDELVYQGLRLFKLEALANLSTKNDPLSGTRRKLSAP